MSIRIAASWSVLAVIGLGSLATSARAQWSPSGLAVCTAPGTQDYPLTATDGAGGAFIAWRDFRDSQDSDLYVQRVTSSGAIAPGWPLGGVPVSTAPFSQAAHVVVADGLGGVIVAWEDQRNVNSTGTDVYAQRILADGEVAEGWPQDGLAICHEAEDQRFLSMVPDGAGGAILAWTDYRDGSGFYNTNPDVYAIRVTAQGGIAGGWFPGGTPIAATLNDEIFPMLAGSGDAGAIVVYQAGVGGSDIYAQRFIDSGTTDPVWPPNGVVLCGARDYQVLDGVCSDGSSGVFAAWRDYRSYPSFGNSFPWLDIYAQHVGAGGQVTIGWPQDGLPICVEPGGQLGVRVTPDGSGGFVACWNDYRSGGGAVFSQRVLGTGAIAPGWGTGGRLVSSLAGAEFKASIAQDGQGGAYIAFENENQEQAWKVYGQHVTGAGALAPGWQESGAAVSKPQQDEFLPSIVRSGFGAIVSWTGGLGYDIYAQKLVTDGPVPTLVSLVRTEAHPDEVLLRWYAAERPYVAVVVERRANTPDWRNLAAVFPDGNGIIEYRDRTVEPGNRYAYRLTYSSDGGHVTTEEWWVDVPRGFSISLEGFRPNPLVGAPVVWFSLASDAQATLELYDSAGRRLLAEDVGQMGPGYHSRSLRAERLVPGVYWLRLNQGAEDLVRRSVVIQ